jgi:CRISPR-associated protein Cas1
VTTPGARLGRTKNRIQVKRTDEVIDEVRLLDVSQVNLHGNVQISSQLMRDLFARDIPICWFSHGGWFSGMATGLSSKHVELRRRQVAASALRGLGIARTMVWGKIRNSRTLLRRNARVEVAKELARLERAAQEALVAERVDSLLGIEGAAARTYFSAFPAMLSDREHLPGLPFTFEGRNRRPPRDPVNCLLSYAYSLLVKDFTAAAFAIGFDPFLGFYHRPRFGRPALALDLAEEFRPLVAESVVIGLINNGEVAPSDFVVRAGGVALTADGRRVVLRAYERRLDAEVTHPTFGYRVTYRRVLEVQCRLLAAHLLGEVPEYAAFTTR